MNEPTTGTTERLHAQDRSAQRVITLSVHLRDHLLHIMYRSALCPRRTHHTSLAFFLGIMLALAAFGAATITPTLGFCILLALVALGLLLAQREGD